MSRTWVLLLIFPKEKPPLKFFGTVYYHFFKKKNRPFDLVRLRSPQVAQDGFDISFSKEKPLGYIRLDVSLVVYVT